MNKEQMTIKALFDTSKTQAGRRLSKYTYPWEVLPHIGEIAEAKDFHRMSTTIWAKISGSINL